MDTSILSRHFSAKAQVLTIDQEHRITKSTDTLHQVTPGQPIADVHPFFSSITAIVDDDSTEFPVQINSVNDIFPQVVYADVTVYQHGAQYQIIIEDQTKQYVLVRDIQQERNSQSIEANLREQQRKSLQLEAELLRLRNEELLSIQNFKSRFFASVSHELRTPISGILGLTDLIDKSDKKQERSKYLQTLQSSAKHLLAMVNDILDLNKMESGKFTLHNEPVILREILDDVTLSFFYQASDKGLKMKTLFDENLPEYVNIDATRLRQILFNLLSNAVKFTHKGNVSLSAKVTNQTDKKINLYLSVKDTGIGLSREQYQKIFEEYEQADSSVSKNYGGTGLGLSVVKRLVEMYNGRIGVESTLGKGSTFSFNLWLDKVSQTPQPPNGGLHSLKKPALKVLIVEDDALSLMILKGIFKKTKAQTTTCLSAKEAQQVIQNKKIDLLITDRQMPELSGDVLAQEFKERFPEGKVILLSGDMLADDDALLQNKIVDVALLKPVNPAQLYQTVDDLL